MALAANMLKISLMAVKKFLLTKRDKKSHQKIMRELGRFLASKTSLPARKKFIQILKFHESFFQNITLNPRVKGIGSLIQLQIEYIKDL